MGKGFVWCVRMALVIVLIATASSVAALFFYVCDIGGELRRVLFSVAIVSFATLVLLVSAMLVFGLGREVSRRIRNKMSRRGPG